MENSITINGVTYIPVETDLNSADKCGSCDLLAVCASTVCDVCCGSIYCPICAAFSTKNGKSVLLRKAKIE